MYETIAIILLVLSVTSNEPQEKQITEEIKINLSVEDLDVLDKELTKMDEEQAVKSGCDFENLDDVDDD